MRYRLAAVAAAALIAIAGALGVLSPAAAAHVAGGVQSRAAASAALAGVAAVAGGVRLRGAPDGRRTCNEQVHWDYNPGASPPFSEAEWTANSCGHYVRGVAHCSNGRSEILGLGGWVTSLNLWSKGHCPAGYLTMIGAAYDTKNCGSCSFTRHWLFGHARLAVIKQHR